MMTVTLWHTLGQASGDTAATPAELDVALNRVAALSRPEWPALSTLTPLGSRFGPVLYVGFHVRLGALLYSGTDDPDGSYTKGHGMVDGQPLRYMYMTSDNEFPSNSEIPAALVRRAAHEFAETGRRPTCVAWQPWNGPTGLVESQFPDR